MKMNKENKNSELEYKQNKRNNKLRNFNLSEIDRYINKLERRLRDKQNYINFLKMVLHKNLIEINKEDYKNFKKGIDYLEIEKEELSSPGFKVGIVDPELNFLGNNSTSSEKEGIVNHHNKLPEPEVMDVVPTLVMSGIGLTMGLSTFRTPIIQEPKGLGVSQVFTDFKEIQKWTHSSSSSIIEEPKQEEIKLIEVFKKIINENDFEIMKTDFQLKLFELEKDEVKNLINLVKRKMKKVKDDGVKEELDNIKFLLKSVYERNME